MNELENITKSMLIKKPRRLTAGQKELYFLLCEKIKNNSILTIDEAKKIYIDFSCQCKKDGIPYWYKWTGWNKEENRAIYEFVPMNEAMIVDATLRWLVYNIGVLVMKGWLKILPIIEFTPLGVCQNANT